LLAAAWLLALQAALAALPEPSGYVNDFASILAEPDEDYLETFLATLERDTSAEVVVVTVNSLDGRTIESYASRLFAEWGIGKKDRDNGVLMLVAPDERSVRIEVGYGLEAALTDGLAGDIIRTEIIPEFAAGNFPRGVGRGLDRIARIVRQDPAAVSSPSASDYVSPLIAVPFTLIFVFMGAFGAGLGLGTRTFGPLLWGGMFGLIPLVILAGSSSVAWAVALGALGLVPLAAGFSKGRTPYWIGLLRTPKTGLRRDDEPLGWEMGGSSGSSSDGSSDGNTSSSSSSSSFGGGSSGGGGASGRW
jgi:uncharacterized protein